MNRRDWTHCILAALAATIVYGAAVLVMLLDDQRCIRIENQKVIRVYDAFSDEIDPLWVEHGTKRQGVEAWLSE